MEEPSPGTPSPLQLLPMSPVYILQTLDAKASLKPVVPCWRLGWEWDVGEELGFPSTIKESSLLQFSAVPLWNGWRGLKSWKWDHSGGHLPNWQCGWLAGIQWYQTLIQRASSWSQSICHLLWLPNKSSVKVRDYVSYRDLKLHLFCLSHLQILNDKKALMRKFLWSRERNNNLQKGLVTSFEVVRWIYGRIVYRSGKSAGCSLQQAKLE